MNLSKFLLSQVKGGLYTFLYLLTFGVNGLFKFLFSLNEVLLFSSLRKCAVTLYLSSSLSLFILDEISLLSGNKLNLFFSAHIKGDGGLFGDNLTLEDPLVDGSNSSFDFSGIIIFKLVFFGWNCSTLSSKDFSLISFITLVIIFIMFEGFNSFGMSFCFD